MPIFAGRIAQTFGGVLFNKTDLRDVKDLETTDLKYLKYKYGRNNELLIVNNQVQIGYLSADIKDKDGLGFIHDHPDLSSYAKMKYVDAVKAYAESMQKEKENQ